MFLLHLFLCYSHFSLISASDWTSGDFALFDLVEEVNENFYSLFSVQQDSPLADIKRAYRRLSLDFHPDRNPTGANRFRQIAAIYEILKSADSRARYDQVLEFGLPDWKQPIFYFRKAHKLTLTETAGLLLLIVSTGHYLMLWGAYVDKYLTLSSSLLPSRKKKAKLEKAEQAADLLAAARPRLSQLLPFRLISFLYWAILSAPSTVLDLYVTLRTPCPPALSEDEASSWTRRVCTHQPNYVYEMATDVTPVPSSIDPGLVEKMQREEMSSRMTDHLHESREMKWTVMEVAQLVKLSTEKYPIGTPNRWELMARCLRRSPDDVAAMAGKLKMMKRDEYAKLRAIGQTSAAVINAIDAEQQSRQPDFAPSSSPDEKRVDDDDHGQLAVAETEEWSKMDQRLFETALIQFPKGTADRWDKIGKVIPNKSKEQCMARFKVLAEMVREKRAANKGK